MGRKLIPVATRFWSKVDIRGLDECWLWLGFKNHKGYGRFHPSSKEMAPAHRVSWELTFGKKIPKGTYACHSCDNPSCVNPHHIWPGTPAQNTTDMIAKGRKRHRRPVTCPQCEHKFTPPIQPPYVRRTKEVAR